jgi:hypothetical protein
MSKGRARFSTRAEAPPGSPKGLILSGWQIILTRSSHGPPLRNPLILAPPGDSPREGLS